MSNKLLEEAQGLPKVFWKRARFLSYFFKLSNIRNTYYLLDRWISHCFLQIKN